MRVLIYGAGAMGTSLGALLERGVPCDYVTRNPRRVALLKEEGRTAFFPSEMAGRYETIVLATRQRENPAVAEFLKAYLEEDGALVTVQNGLPEAGLAERLGADRVYGCALGWGAETDADGRVKVTSREYSLALGAYGKGERLNELAQMFSQCGVSVTVGDLAEIRYAKLVVNAAFSTLSAASGLTFGELAHKYGGIVLSLMRETVAVGRAQGCKKLVQNGHDVGKLASPFARYILPFAIRKHKNIRSGMLKDLAAGKRCDVDFVAGAVVRAGELCGVATPALRAAVALVHDVENGLAELSPESLKLLNSKRIRGNANG